jgi:hypothetical protein
MCIRDRSLSVLKVRGRGLIGCPRSNGSGKFLSPINQQPLVPLVSCLAPIPLPYYTVFRPEVFGIITKNAGFPEIIQKPRFLPLQIL